MRRDADRNRFPSNECGAVSDLPTVSNRVIGPCTRSGKNEVNSASFKGFLSAGIDSRYTSRR